MIFFLIFLISRHSSALFEHGLDMYIHKVVQPHVYACVRVRVCVHKYK